MLAQTNQQSRRAAEIADFLAFGI